MPDTPVVERPFPVSGLQIQMRVGDQRGDMVFSTVIDQSCDDDAIFELVDRMTRVIDREKLKAEKADMLAHLRRNRELIASGKIDKDIDALRRQRADQDKASVAQFVAGNKRGEYRPSARDRTALADFDQKIATAEKAKFDLAAGIPIAEWQIACLDARIKDRPEPPMPEAVEAALRAIEFPEDVSIAA